MPYNILHNNKCLTVKLYESSYVERDLEIESSSSFCATSLIFSHVTENVTSNAKLT
jgi:hypothetical protein